VDASPEGDAFFPAIGQALWSTQSQTRFEAGEGNDHGFTINVLDRVTTPA
jgi:hypothetical protein